MRTVQVIVQWYVDYGLLSKCLVAPFFQQILAYLNTNHMHLPWPSFCPTVLSLVVSFSPHSSVLYLHAVFPFPEVSLSNFHLFSFSMSRNVTFLIWYHVLHLICLLTLMLQSVPQNLDVQECFNDGSRNFKLWGETPRIIFRSSGESMRVV